MRRLVPLVSLVFSLAAASSVGAQSATALLTEGAALPGAPGQTVTSLNNVAVNQVGGWAATVNATDGVDTISHVWGNAAGGTGDVLRSEGVFGGLTQTSFESFYGISDSGQVAYSPSSNSATTTGLDGVWLDDTVIAIEEDPVPGQPGQFWSFGSRPGVTAGGVPYWVGGLTDTAGGSSQNRGLFLGASATVLYQGGQAVPGLPFVLDTASSVSFDYGISADGTNSIAEVQLDGGTSSDNNALVLSGSGLLVDGTLVREGSAVPAAAGGLVGENWDNFDQLGVNEAGSYFFTGDTDGATATDEIVVVDGSIVLREGDTVDGETLSGAIEGANRNEDGDLAVVWDIATGEEVLLFNGRIVLREGDAVDLDGDGMVEPGSLLADFTGISNVRVSARDGAGMVDVYVTADIDTNGTTTTSDDTEALLRLRLQAALTADRNAGTNPASLTSTVAVIGETLSVSIDLGGTTGHSSALLIGFATPLTLTLGGGQTLLVNVADPGGEQLGLVLMPGPSVTYDLPVPNDTAFLGFEVSVQAIHIGTVVPFALSNAADLTVGY